MTRTTTHNERPRTGNCASVMLSDGYTGDFACAFTPGHEKSCAYRPVSAVPPNPLAPVYNWLVDDLHFPFDLHTDRPEWLDIRWVAELWRISEGGANDTTEDYVMTILAETGWDVG